MFDCEFLPQCLSNLAKMPIRNSVAEIKKRYCQNENSICARYIVIKALGQEKAPNDLYPYQLERSIKIIQNKEATASVS